MYKVMLNRKKSLMHAEEIDDGEYGLAEFEA